MIKRLRKEKKRFPWLLVGGLVLLTLALSTAIGIGANYYMQIRKDLPDVDQLKEYRPSLITTVYSDSGEVIGKFFIEKRILLSLSELPDLLIKAFIAIEDARFYKHRGVDLQGISRAFWANLRAKQIMQGGSTITQQLAKTLFLTPEKTIRRKVKEVILALEIEKRFTKGEILELYLNQIYFGAGAYGVEAAAETYFGKHVGELNLAEIALLASLPKSPARFDPFKYPERAKERRSLVLARMYGEHFITLEERNLFDDGFLVLKEKETSQDASAYFVEHVRRYLMGRYGSQKLYQSGLEVHTTLNLKMQRSAVRALRTGLRDYDKRHGYRGPLGHVLLGDEELDVLRELKGQSQISEVSSADESYFHVDEILEGTVVELEESGAWVLTYGVIGFLPFEELEWAKKAIPREDLSTKDQLEWSEPKSPEDVFSVGDLILARVLEYDPILSQLILSLEQEPKVQGGLIALDPATGEIKAMVGGYDFKTSEFNRTVQAKRQPGSAFKPIIYGAAVQKGFSPASIIIDTPVIFQDLNMQEKWKPANYSEKFYGPTRLRVALAKSRNVVTIRLLQKVGVRRVVDFARRLGIASPLSQNYSLALGSSGTTLLELTSAYSVYANHGKRADPIYIRQIMDYDGNVIEEPLPFVEDVLDPDVAYILTNMLEGVVKQGTGRRMLQLGRPSAGKTGTTNNFLDALYIGFVPDLVTGVWVGYDDLQTLGKGESGAKAASPIWLSFMKEATQDLERLPFSAPPGIVFVKVDKETGLLPSSEKQEAYYECFRKGSEPREYAPLKSTRGEDFFDLDSDSLRSPLSEETPPSEPKADRL
jgi:penicillin-binding protein 1A